MKRIRRFLSPLVAINFMIINLVGCATAIHTKPLFQYEISPYQISPLPFEKRINKIAGFNKFLDNRPQGGKEILSGYEAMRQSLSDKISFLLVTDFEKSQVFKVIHCPVQSTDDIVINYSIDRFEWEHREKTFTGKLQECPLTVFLPVLALPFLAGAPILREHYVIDILLEIKDNKTGAIIAQLKESFKVVQAVSLYSSSKLKQDATETFSNVVNKFKKELSEKINSYFNSQMAGVAGEE